jgi:sugar/nucleoside kinase (ribokinase family)
LKDSRLILGLGELLWDLLPEGPRLGGAPANFTVMAGRLGNHAVLLSRIGRDELGQRALGILEPMPADTGFIETDPVHETGRVTVHFENGQPQMNDEEVPQVLGLLGLASVSPGEDEPAKDDLLRTGAALLLKEFPNLRMVAVTCGGQGSLLVKRDEWHRHPGLPVKVADTIGAGDAFTAALTHAMLRGAGLATLNEAGNRWGGWVASQSGAMPPLAADVQAAIEAAIGV